jgi:ubiquinone/menaquinone biosynthesis C-methylase UbiE
MVCAARWPDPPPREIEVDYTTTDAAARFDAARRLSDETLAAWMNALAAHVPVDAVSRAIDVGCGTGRFTAALARRFDADVLGVDPSAEMLEVARARVAGAGAARVRFAHAPATPLPVEPGAADLVFLSQVFHHLDDRPAAFAAFAAALAPGGHLCLRNSTADRLDDVPYFRHFPGARRVNEHRIPSVTTILETVTRHPFEPVAHEVVRQVNAPSLAAYVERIALRGHSDLAALSDAEFERGLAAMAADGAAEESPAPVCEPIDLFVFRRVIP